MTSTTPMLCAVTSPSRFGYEIVDVFFGQVSVRMNQTIAVARPEGRGDLLRDKTTGKVAEFLGRTGNQIILGSVE